MLERKITLGIDLGTTYSAVAYVDEHGDAKIIPNQESERITPSVVFFENKDNIVIGQTAKDEAELEPDKVVSFVKREMGKNNQEVRKEENHGMPKPFEFYGKLYSPEEISALILKKLKKDAEAFFQGKEISDAIITVPAYFNDSERLATKQAGEIAGLNVLKVINEPTAAALAYGLSTAGNSPQTVFAFDLGGGTFDVTILKIESNNGKKEINVINTDGDHRLGGKDWDDKIIEFVANEFISRYGEDPRDNKDTMADLRIRAEKAKKSLSSRDKAKIITKTEENSLKTEITRQQFEEITSDLMSRIEGLCDIVLRDANLSWNDIDIVLLAGGSTRMPMVQEFLKRISGKEIKTDLINPDECVAKGAAIQSTIVEIEKNPTIASQEIKDKLGSVKVNDVTSHTLGVVSVNENNEQIVSPILPKGTKVPSIITKRFGTLVDNQSSVLIQVKEGESTNPENSKTIQEVSLEIISQLPANSPIDVTYEMSDDGMLLVIGNDVTNNKQIRVEVERKSNLTKEGVKDAERHLKTLDVSG